MFRQLDFVQIPSQVDAFALTGSFRFHNIGADFFRVFLLVDLELELQVIGIHWQEPCLRVELEVFLESFAHLIKILAEVILSGKRIHAWEVIHSLERLQSLQFVWLDGCVTPEQVEVFVALFIFLDFHLEAFSRHFPHNIVLAVVHINV